MPEALHSAEGALPAALARFLAIDFAPLVAVTAAALSLGLLGNFLVLRRQAMLGDAVAHAVLPGLVVAFLVSQSRASLPMLVGALGAGLAAAFLTQALVRHGRVERGAALGVVFTALLALGVYLIESRGARNVDLDADCVLNGQLELLFWTPPGTWSELLSLRTLAALPHQVPVLLGVTLVTLAFITVLWKELRLASFDPAFAHAIGMRPGLVEGLVVGLVAIAMVTSFEALGSILVVALLVCPAATARLLTDRLRTQVVLSGWLGVGAGLVGYAGAILVPAALGAPAVDAAGAVATTSGLGLLCAALFGPRRKGAAPSGA